MIPFTCSESVDEIGDLYLDVAEAYMDKGYYTECKPLLATLVDSEKYNLVRILNCGNRYLFSIWLFIILPYHWELLGLTQRINIVSMVTMCLTV